MLGDEVDALQHAGVAEALFQGMHDDATHRPSSACAQGKPARERRASA
jgi:hypothetical protein